MHIRVRPHPRNHVLAAQRHGDKRVRARGLCHHNPVGHMRDIGRVAICRVLIGDGFGANAQHNRFALPRGHIVLTEGQRHRCPIMQRHLRHGATVLHHDSRRHHIHRGRSHERRHKDIGRRVIDLLRGAKLLHIAAIHHRNPRRQGHCLDLVMGDINDGGAQLLVQLLDLCTHVHAQFSIKVRQRLIKQKHIRIAHQRPAHSHPLTLPAGQSTGLAVQQRFDLQKLRDILHRPVPLGLGRAMHLKTKGDVLTHRHVWVERVGLEHHRDIALGRVDPIHNGIPDADLAAGDLFQPRDHVQQRGLATTGRADQHQKLALLHRNVDLVQHFDRAIGLGCVVDIEKAHRSIL
mmetsp:Transcript_28726/g.54376  ORF Transcript_28726/g.54376 Transcript_28726/m.54376 type:complete len:348 (+) Transcript_28726:2360-3403(+)